MQNADKSKGKVGPIYGAEKCDRIAGFCGENVSGPGRTRTDSRGDSAVTVFGDIESPGVVVPVLVGPADRAELARVGGVAGLSEILTDAAERHGLARLLLLLERSPDRLEAEGELATAARADAAVREPAPAVKPRRLPPTTPAARRARGVVG